MSKIIPIRCITRLDLEADQVIEEAHGKLESVVVLGWTKDDCEYFASSIADGGTVLWLLERLKAQLIADSEHEL